MKSDAQPGSLPSKGARQQATYHRSNARSARGTSARCRSRAMSRAPTPALAPSRRLPSFPLAPQEGRCRRCCLPRWQLRKRYRLLERSARQQAASRRACWPTRWRPRCSWEWTRRISECSAQTFPTPPRLPIEVQTHTDKLTYITKVPRYTGLRPITSAMDPKILGDTPASAKASAECPDQLQPSRAVETHPAGSCTFSEESWR